MKIGDNATDSRGNATENLAGAAKITREEGRETEKQGAPSCAPPGEAGYFLLSSGAVDSAGMGVGCEPLIWDFGRIGCIPNSTSFSLP